MYGHLDFIINEASEDDLGKNIIKHITLNRIKWSKPCIILITGDSGEGKSSTSLKIGEVIAEEETKDMEVFLTKQIIYTPFEYADKLNWILFSPEARGKHVLIFMEARELVKAKTWYSVINQSIADINAMSRAVKPLIFILVTQDIGDIDRDQRKPINYYGICDRPLGHPVEFKLYKVQKTRWLENAKMRQRTMKGLWKQTDGSYKKIYLDKLVMGFPSPNVWQRFLELDREAKTKIIQAKLERLKNLLETEKPKLTRLESVVEVMMREPAILQWAMRRTKTGKIKIRPELGTLYNLNANELKEVGQLLMTKLAESGMYAIEKKSLEIKEEETGEVKQDGVATASTTDAGQA